jgi:hypothetical protein
MKMIIIEKLIEDIINQIFIIKTINNFFYILIKIEYFLLYT